MIPLWLFVLLLVFAIVGGILTLIIGALVVAAIREERGPKAEDEPPPAPLRVVDGDEKDGR